MSTGFDINEQGRPAAPDVGDVALPGIAKALAQQERRLHQEAAARNIEMERRFYDRLAQGATHTFALDRALKHASTVLAETGHDALLRGLELARNRLVRWLAENGVEIEDPTGEALDERLQGLVEVEDWSAPGDAEQDSVRETLAPILRLGDGRILPGRVIGQPGRSLSAVRVKEER